MKGKYGGRRKPGALRRKPKHKRSGVPSLKPYYFDFKLKPQTLVGNIGGPGGLVLSTTTGQLPISSTGPPSWSVQTAESGLPGFYDIGIAVAFKLSDIKQYLGYSALFDAYRVDKVGCEIEFLSNFSAVNGNSLMPTMWMYWDQDDAIVPTSSVLLTGKQGAKCVQFGNHSTTKFKTSHRPRVATGILDNTGTVIGAGIGSAGKQWLDCVNTDVPHYALKLWISDVYLPGTFPIAFKFNWEYKMSFRAPILTY